jgi:hypothetical protein
MHRKKMYVMCYMMVYKIGFQGNLPIAHNSLWVMEVMLIETKFGGRRSAPRREGVNQADSIYRDTKCTCTSMPGVIPEPTVWQESKEGTFHACIDFVAGV